MTGQPGNQSSTGLCHVEINVSDYARSIRFYDRVLIHLGWKKFVCSRTHTTYCDGQLKLVLVPTESGHLTAGFHRKRTGLNHLAFYAPSREAVDRFDREVLKATGIKALYEGKPFGDDEYYAVFFEDPDRMKLEVVHAPRYCDPSAWPNTVESDFNPSEESVPV